MFVFFPNFFEVAFLWLVIFHPVRTTILLTDPQPWGWLVALLIVKQIHEFILHYVAEKYNWYVATEAFYNKIFPWRKANIHKSMLRQ